MGINSATDNNLKSIETWDKIVKIPVGTWGNRAQITTASFPAGAGNNAYKPATVIKSGSTYYLFYYHYDTNAGTHKIHVATAKSLTGTWTWQANIISTGAAGQWDDALVIQPCVIKDGNTWKMWYIGGRATPTRKIGYATATNPLGPWTKYVSNPILEPTGAGWENTYIYTGGVAKVGSKYMMYYGGKGSVYQIGIAYSDDGITFTRYASNPVVLVGAGGTWDDTSTLYNTIFYDTGTYYLIYSGANAAGTWKIGLATSNDGFTFIKCPYNPTLSTGTAGTFDDYGVFHPCAIREGNTFYLFYAGMPDVNNCTICQVTI